MPFGERQPLAVDEPTTAEGLLKQCIILLHIYGEIDEEETERLIAELGLKHA